MKIKDLISTLEKYHDPDTEIAVIWWTADEFDHLFDEEDNPQAAVDAVWPAVVSEFEGWEDRDQGLGEWLQQAILDRAEA